MNQEIPEDVLFCLDREPLVVSVCIVQKLHVEVRPDTTHHFASELEQGELGFFRLAIAQLVHKVLILLHYKALKLRVAPLDRRVPHVVLTTEEPLAIFCFYLVEQFLALWNFCIVHDS